MKESKLEERAKILLPKLTSNDVAQESFEAIKNNKKTKTVNSFRPELTAKLTKRLHLDPLAWLSQRDIFNEKLKMALQEVVAALNNPTFKENDIYDNNCSDEDVDSINDNIVSSNDDVVSINNYVVSTNDYVLSTNDDILSTNDDVVSTIKDNVNSTLDLKLSQTWSLM